MARPAASPFVTGPSPSRAHASSVPVNGVRSYRAPDSFRRIRILPPGYGPPALDQDDLCAAGGVRWSRRRETDPVAALKLIHRYRPEVCPAGAAGASAGGCSGWIRSTSFATRCWSRGAPPGRSRARWGSRATRCAGTSRAAEPSAASRWPGRRRSWRRSRPRIEAMLGDVAALDGRQAAADRDAAAPDAARRGAPGRRHAGQGGGRRVEAAAAGGVRAARLPPGRSRRGRLLRGARRRGRRAAQGVDVPDAPDALGPRLRLALRRARTRSASSTATSGRSRISARCRSASPTTISGRGGARCWSAPSAS